MTQTLPYFEPFPEGDGSSWPGWQSPGPNWVSSVASDVHNHRGRITLTSSNGAAQFNARLVTDDAPTYDLVFQFDLSEVMPLLTVPDPNIWLQVQMGGPNSVLTSGDGSTFFQIYLDTVDGLQAAVFVYGSNTGYVTLPHINTAQPMWVRMVESGTDRKFKIWQGAEPTAFTLTTTTVPHTGPRYIDLYVYARTAGTPHVYVDEIAINGPALAYANQALPYYEPFEYPDGDAWPLAAPQTSGWLIPGPSGMSASPASVNVNGGLAEIELTPDWVSGVPMFSARLPIDDAPTFDLSFTLDMAEIEPLMSDRGASCYFYVQLENAADGVVQYEISYDYDWDEDEGVDHSTPRLRARMNPWGHPVYAPAGTFLLADAHTMSTFNTAAPVSVRIQETGTIRSFKVWQGIEPSDWTIQFGTASTHTGPRFIDLSIYTIQNGTASVYLDDIRANATGSDTTFTLVGSTDHFNFWYETVLGNRGLVDATDAMAYAEYDLQNLFAWFGKTAPWTNGPARLDVKFIRPQDSGISGALAYYAGYTEGITILWDVNNPATAVNAGYRGMFLHEMAHHFQVLQGYRWGNAASMLEAQATFLDREFRRSIGDYDSLTAGGYADRVPYWINSTDRPDFVNHVVADQNPPFDYAVGCTLLFFNYLRWHRGYSPAAITQHPGTTMRAAYRSLTGDPIDPFPPFLDGIDTAFQRGQTISPFAVLDWPSKDIANPYPLPGTTDPLQPGGGGLASLYNILGPGLTAQIRQSWHRR